MSAHRDLRNSPLVLHIGREELIIRRRYETASIINDILIACWFIVGSVMFFYEAWTIPGTWCFLAGSIELLVRPVLRLSRHLHVQKVHARTPSATAPDEAEDVTGDTSASDDY